MTSASDPEIARILIVDDTRAIHHDFRKILAPRERNSLDEAAAKLFGDPPAPRPRTSFMVDSAYQGSESLTLVRSALQEGRPYALAFVDVRMPPGWDGIETVEKLWAVEPDLQVVLCTAHSDYSWEEIVRRLGATENLVVLKKPFDNVEVLQLAYALVKKWRLTRQSQSRLADLDRAVNQRTKDLQLFSKLGQRLSAAPTAKEAARIIVEAADQLLGWDACFCDLYSAKHGTEIHVLNIDLFDGQRVECKTAWPSDKPSPLARQALEEGGFMILREHPERLAAPGDALFGNTLKRSASLLFVPIRNGAVPTGVLSIQSYKPKAYGQHSLDTLQILADHCGGALERIRAQEALKESEANYRLLVERSPTAIFVHQDGRFVYVNPSGVNLLGTGSAERLVGKEIFEVIPQEFHELVAQRLQIVAHGETASLVEQKILQLDGTVLDIEVTSSPLFYEGKPAVQTIMRDISERKQAELRLAAFSTLGQRLSSAKTAKAAAEIVVDVADRLIGWDACSCNLYSAAEDLQSSVLHIDTIDGKRAECLPTPACHCPSEMARRALVEGGQLILRTEAEAAGPGTVPFGDTSRRSASILYVPIRNGADIIGSLSIQSYRQNAYDRRSLELLQSLADHCGGALDRIAGQEALLKAEERLHHVLAQSPGVIYSLKPEGERFVLSWISENLVQLLGFTPSEACQPAWGRTNLHPDDRPRLKAARAQLFREHRAEMELRFRHKDGTYRWLRDEQRLILGPDGQPAEIVGTSMDITERKQLEEQLRHSQKMEVVGQLAGGVAHDFNNLLAVIKGNAELLLTDPSRLPPEGVDSLQQLLAAADRAASLTRQLLAFGRKQLLQSQPLNLNEAVGNLADMLRRTLGDNIQLRCTCAPALPWIQADAGMIAQVLLNLALNSRDAMPQGGQLCLSTQASRFSASDLPSHPEARPGEFVCLAVTDTGAGIAAEHLPHIFEPFFTTKELGKGTGLGLATAYGIIQQHHGWIEVASQLGHGSTFKVFLPASPQGPTPPIKPVPDRPSRGQETILLVEDDPAVRSLTRRVLEHSGYKVREAATGRQALELFPDQLPEIDLLLTDITMPEGVSGGELAERLRANRPTLKTIFMTGYSAEVLGADPAELQRFKGRLLQKPFACRDLVQTVRECLDEPLRPAGSA
jgi:PAS domain S-box-containing protein